MDWAMNEGCARQAYYCLLGLLALLIGAAVGLGYALRWLTERAR